ncbi:MAG: T9SS type A sorting domain-containing protein, partial [Saprospiraceae bacterium]|nr:T9SS type A sorting domain-containing protein [Saprospiraceae bacterium]
FIFSFIVQNVFAQLDCNNAQDLFVNIPIGTSTTGSSVVNYCNLQSSHIGGTKIFRLTGSGSYTVSLTNFSNTDLDLFIIFDCDPTLCIGSSTFSNTSDESVTVCGDGGGPVNKGAVTYIVVHGYTGNGEFSILLTEECCTGNVGFQRICDIEQNNSCGVFSGTMVYPFGISNSISKYLPEDGNIVGNPEYLAEEIIYTIPVSTGSINAQLTSVTNHNIDVALIGKHKTSGWVRCFVQADNSFSNVNLNSNYDYFVTVDSRAFWGTLNQDYTINIEYVGCTNPVPSCTEVTSPLSGSNISSNQTIVWAAVSNAIGYKLTVGTTQSGTQIINNLDVGNVTTYQLNNLPLGPIFIKVVPYNDFGNAINCNTLEFFVQDCSFCPVFVPSYSNCAGFENLNTGNLIPQGSPQFSLFTSNNNSHQAQVVNTITAGGFKSVKYGNTSNIDYNISRTITSPTRLEWMMYIPTEKSGSWALETNAPNLYTFIARYNNGILKVVTPTQANGEIQVANLQYPENTWFKVSIIIRPKVGNVNGSLEIFNNRQFVYKRIDYGSNLLTDLNFYSISNVTNTEYYIDNICYQESTLNSPCTAEYNPVCVNGQVYSNPCYARKAGYTENEWQLGDCTGDYCDGCLKCFRYIPKYYIPRTINFYSQFCDDPTPTRLPSSYTAEWTVNSNVNIQYVDNTSSTSLNPVILFPSNGTYIVCYKLYFGGALVYECCQTITVGPCNGGPIAYFSATNNASNNTFTLNSSGSTNASSIQWEFSETGVQYISGNVSSTSPVISIPSGKCINVCLIASNGCGMSTYCLKLCRNNTTCSGTLPPVYITNPITPSINDKTVSITLPNPGNNQATYKWKFGDGGTSAAQSINYSYPHYGNYIICVEIKIGCFIYCYCWFVHLDPCTPVFEPHDGMLRPKFGGNESTMEYIIESNNITIAQGQPWLVDDVPVTNSAGLANLTVALPQNKDYVICFPYLKPNGCLAYKCITMRGGNPFSCTSIGWKFVQNSGYQFNLSAGFSDISWTLDETGQSLGTTATSNFVLPVNPCGWRTISVRYFDGTRYWICCLRIYLCAPDDCFGNIYYGFSNDNGQFHLEESGATNISWYFDDAPNTILGTSSTISVPYPVNCITRWISVKYKDASGRWRICCRLVYFCNPFNCDLIKINYVDGSGYKFSLDQTYQNMSWIIDETSQSLGSGVESTFYPVPTTCEYRTVTVRFFVPGIGWRMCCYRFWSCNPALCSDRINITQSGANYTLSTTSTYQNITWFRESTQLGTGNNLNAALPSTGTYKIYIRYYNPSDKCWYWCCRLFTPGGGSSTPPWPKLPTGQNHTIIVPLNVISEIGGMALKSGDFIGIFFNRDGQLICSNFEEWKGSVISIAAFGNDANPPSKNGFNLNEQFQFIVWRGSESKEYPVQATFEDPPQFPRDATDKWKKDGLSLLKSLKTSNKVTQIITLRQNWNTISSYVNPDNPDMLALLASLGNKVVLIKDEKGKSAIPSQGINDLGNWDVKKGYQIRMIESTTLSITGTKTEPSANPISVSSEWKIISNLCENGNSPASQWSSIASSIVIIKDQDGKSYIPSAMIDDLKCLKPGFGYHVRGINNASFTYNCSGNCNPFHQEVVYSRSTEMPYNIEPLNSGNNATIVFTQQVCESFLLPEDIIYVFNSSGMLCGKWKYDGTAIGMPVWGDDLHTGDVIEGLLESEPMIFKIKSHDGRFYDMNIKFKDADNIYTRDGIYYAAHLEKVAEEKNQDILIYPNPTSQWVNVSFLSNEIPQNVEISIFDGQGKMVQKFDSQNPETNDFSIPVQSLHSGVYLFRINLDNRKYYKKVLITN